jgi:hypothetical protein
MKMREGEGGLGWVEELSIFEEWIDMIGGWASFLSNVQEMHGGHTWDGNTQVIDLECASHSGGRLGCIEDGTMENWIIQ